MKVRDPRTGQWRFFVDKCLPFGASISCALFQKFSDALCFKFEHQTNTQGQVTDYLDNFLFLALTIWRCNYLIKVFLDLCKEMGIPVSMEKTEWASDKIIFLGILMDGRYFTLAVPMEKRNKVIKLLNEMVDKKKATVKQLQALCGFLNFLSKAIFPGRTFTRCMYAKFSEIVNIGGFFTEVSQGLQTQTTPLCVPG